MKVLRLHRSLYSGKAVDAAMKQLESHATFERVALPEYWQVEVHARNPAQERGVAGVLANFALGLTIEQGGAQQSAQEPQQ